jgi:hypothetical protein
MATVEEMNALAAKLPPGVYQLVKDVVNPAPDRRQKYDWRLLPLWTKGKRFIVSHQTESHKAAGQIVTWTVARVVPETGGSHMLAGNGDERFNALVDALAPADESVDSIMNDQRNYVNGGYEHVVKELVHSGKITLEDLRVARDAELRDDE